MSRAAAIATRPHLRRDAAANRQHLIDAAWQVFADRGLDASVEEIARVAGVGVGTLYRRFSTKDALVAALVQDVLDAMLAFAEDAATAVGSSATSRRRAPTRLSTAAAFPGCGTPTSTTRRSTDSVRRSAGCSRTPSATAGCGPTSPAPI